MPVLVLVVVDIPVVGGVAVDALVVAGADVDPAFVVVVMDILVGR